MPLYLSIHIRMITKSTVTTPQLHRFLKKLTYQIKEYKGLFINLQAMQDKVWLSEIRQIMNIFYAPKVRLLIIRNFFNGEEMDHFYLSRNLNTLKRPKKIIQFGIHLALLMPFLYMHKVSTLNSLLKKQIKVLNY